MNFLSNDSVVEMEHDFKGKGRERRAAKKDARNDRKKERISLRAEGKNARAGIIGNILNSAKSALGGEAPIEDVSVDKSGLKVDFGDPEADAKKKQKQTIIIIGAIVVILVVAVVFIKMKNKH